MSDTEVPMKRTRARRGEGEQLRGDILEATERLLIGSGDEEEVSIRAVAEAVGVTPPSIYLHFADKSELLFAVCERHFNKLDRLMEEAGAQAEEPLWSLYLRGRAYIRFGLHNPEPYRILFMGKPDATPAAFEPDRLRQSAAFDHLVEAVQRCMDAGDLAPSDPTLVAMGLWSAAHGLTSLLIAKPDWPWPDVDLLTHHVLATQIFGLRDQLPPPPPG